MADSIKVKWTPNLCLWGLWQEQGHGAALFLGLGGKEWWAQGSSCRNYSVWETGRWSGVSLRGGGAGGFRDRRPLVLVWEAQAPCRHESKADSRTVTFLTLPGITSLPASLPQKLFHTFYKCVKVNKLPLWVKKLCQWKKPRAGLFFGFSFKLRKSAQRLCWLVCAWGFCDLLLLKKDISWLPIGLHRYIAKYSFCSLQREGFFLHQFLLNSGLSSSFMSLQNWMENYTGNL